MFRILFALAVAAVVSGDVRAQGHSIGSNEVTVQGSEQFENWVRPVGTITIDADGAVQPRQLLRNTNAVLDIVDFLRERPPGDLAKKAKEDIVLLDAIEGASNREGVVNVFDGLADTYWEPEAFEEDLDFSAKWWFSVDLGRTVIANRIVLKFAPEGEGDPFLLFDVLTSDGQKPIAALSGDDVEYLPVLQTLTPNTTQREFEIDLTSTSMEGREQLVRYVQVIVKGSAADRAQEVENEEAYLALDAEDRGLVEYIKYVGVGSDRREFSVSQELHERLEGTRRGPIRYFRRERPRLAELEVWGEGDEIMRGAINRGGSFSFFQDFDPQLIIDGNVGSTTSVKTAQVDVGGPRGELFMDLGSSYWVESMRMITSFRGSGHTVSFADHHLDFSDGSREPDGSFTWQRAASIEQDELGQRSVTRYIVPSTMVTNRAEFDAVKARFFQLVFDATELSDNNYAAIAEMQLFGSGYQPEVWLESDPILLPGSQNLTEISWEADTPPGTRVVLQTKTGNTLLSDTLYYKDDGSLLGRGEPGAKKYYSRAFKNSQGPKVLVFEEGPEWSELSEIYEHASGSTITSPAPRKILKVRATLLSDTPDAAATLRSIKLNFSDPVARRLLAEVTPTRVEVLGIEQSFSLFVSVDSLAQGFNELLIQAPSGMVIGQDDTIEEQVRLFTGPASVDELELSDGPLQVLGYGDSLHVRFPLLDADIEVLRLDFPAILYSAGGRLEASLRHSDSRFWQRADVGDAVQEVTSNGLLVVAVPESKELFQDLKIEPRVATPNGDTVNDELVAEFTVVLLGGNETVEMEIFDLSGHLVRRLTQRRTVSSGRYRMAWDGIDSNDRLVPPGLYTMRLGIEADTDGAGLDKSTVLQTVAVTY